jgi:hypothetical protein
MDISRIEADRHEKESQIRIIIERYNELELSFRAVERECEERDIMAAGFEEDIISEIKNVKDTLKKIGMLMGKIEKERLLLAKEFRKSVKTDIMKRLEKRVDQLKYEEFISKDELYRLLERYKKN